MNKIPFIIFLMFFVFVVSGFTNAVDYSEEYTPISVIIDGKSHDIFYKIARRKNLNESSEYRITDDVAKEVDFYVSGFRRYEGRPGSTRWNIEINNLPDETLEGSILLDIYLKNNRYTAREVYTDIFRQIFEKVGGFPEDNYPY